MTAALVISELIVFFTSIVLLGFLTPIHKFKAGNYGSTRLDMPADVAQFCAILATSFLFVSGVGLLGLLGGVALQFFTVVSPVTISVVAAALAIKVLIILGTLGLVRGRKG